MVTVDHPTGAVNGQARVQILLLTGANVTGSVETDYRCPFSGKSETGNFEIQFRDLKQIQFLR